MTASTNETAPKGKRTVRVNRYGNLVAYISGKVWTVLGEAYAPHTETLAEQFLAGIND